MVQFDKQNIYLKINLSPQNLFHTEWSTQIIPKAAGKKMIQIHCLLSFVGCSLFIFK